MAVYIGARYVPKIMGVWDKTKTYEPLSIVTYSGSSYTSKQNVPVNIEITNETYWAETGGSSGKISEIETKVNNAVSTANTANTTANNAMTKATTADTKATTANTMANTAKTTADEAKTIATLSDGKATTANTTANSALSTAQNANNKVDITNTNLSYTNQSLIANWIEVIQLVGYGKFE